LYQWQTLPLSDKTMCSDGSVYEIFARRGESSNVMIYFAGGGACWDGASCSQPITPSNFSGFYFPTIWELIIPFLDGIFKATNPTNPFRDWTEVYIPYCTADLHVGATTNTYPVDGGDPVTIHHNGRQNVTEALDWVYANVGQPEKLMIAGESAGAWGSIFWTPTIAAHYPDSAIYQLADGAFIPTERWNEFMTTWKADFQTNFGFDPGNDVVGNAYLHYAENPLPSVTYLHDNTVFDTTIIWFAEQINGVNPASDEGSAYIETWSQGVRESMQKVSESGLNYSYYLTDFGADPETGLTPHTMLSNERFFATTQDGVLYSDWLKRIVFDGERFSVGTGFMDEK
ncbi:MAG TPA: pectin acetylesterase-family hydrolase, partial [Phototrophicaceae bacterium]|jgi:hypothetical protein|nr:pectin acetylesterase-family hydrolase [Phototrophicaceae bacterium]